MRFRPTSSANPERIHMAKNLIGLIRSRGLNDAEAARRIGITPDAMSTYTRARSFPGPENLQKIANFFRVPVTYFMLESSYVPDRTIDPLVDARAELEAARQG